MSVTVKRLRKLFRCNVETGVLRYRVDRCSGQYGNILSARAGDVAGHRHKHSKRWCIFVDGQYHYRHVLVWLWVTGELPPEGMELDHIDGDKSNDAFDNLRLCTRQQNMCNKRLYRNSTVGLKGVTRLPSGRFMSQIQANKQHHYLGSFDTAELAHRAYCRAARRLHGEFARTA